MRLVDDALECGVNIGGRTRDVHAHITGSVTTGKREVAQRDVLVETQDAVLHCEAY